MDIEATKLELMQLLLHTQKESLLSKLKKVFEEEPADWWNEITAEEQEEIRTGISQADKGQYVEHKEVMERFKKWH